MAWSDHALVLLLVAACLGRSVSAGAAASVVELAVGVQAPSFACVSARGPLASACLLRRLVWSISPGPMSLSPRLVLSKLKPQMR
jgi:hypothetical protein